MKIIKLTESDLHRIVRKVISEQDPMRTAVKTVHDLAKYKEKTKISEKYPCVNSKLLLFVDYVMKNKSTLMNTLKVDLPTLILLTKVSIGIVGRETKFGEFETSRDKAVEMLRSNGAGSLLDWAQKTFHPSKSPSLGLGQFQKETWIKYGLDKTIGDYDKSFNDLSQGLAVLYSLNIRYKQAIANGLTTQPSENRVLSKYGVITKINGTGNHALDMAILSHNMRPDKTLFTYCTTNHPLYASPCFKQKYSPFTNKESFDPNSPLLKLVKDPKLKQFPGELTVNRSQVIPNFFPNLKGPEHTAIGYVEEVMKYVKSLNCF